MTNRIVGALLGHALFAGGLACAGDAPDSDGGPDAPAQDGAGDKSAEAVGGADADAADGGGGEAGGAGAWKKAAGLVGCEISYKRAMAGDSAPSEGGPAQRVSFSVGGSIRNLVGFFRSQPAAGGAVTVDVREGMSAGGGPGPAVKTREVTPGESLPATPAGAAGGGEFYKLEFSKPATIMGGASAWVVIAATGLGVDGRFDWYYDRPVGGAGTGVKATLLPGSDRVNFEFGVNCP